MPPSANQKLGLPRSKMHQYYFAFDIDGTLRSNTVDQTIAPVPNEDIRLLLVLLKRAFKNIRIVVWSGSGELYAHQVGASFGLDKYVSHYMAKEAYKDFCARHNVIAIDDIQDTAIGNIANLIVNQK